ALGKECPTAGVSKPSPAGTPGSREPYTVTLHDAHPIASTLATGNITLNHTGTATGTVGVSGSGTTRTVTISGISGDGSLGISVTGGAATAVVGTSAPGAGRITTVTVDNTAPTISIASPS